MTVTILVVDDEEDVRLSLRMMLRRPGWAIVEAASGEEALEMVRRGRVDVLILDHKMPGLAGIDVARILRGEGFRRPIILYSAYLTPQIEATAEELGVWAVAKEDVEELMDTLQDVTENGQRKTTVE